MAWRRAVTRRRALALVVVPLASVAALFAWNGLEGSWETPESGVTAIPPAAAGRQIRILSFNVAKFSFHRGGLDFASDREVGERLDAVAAMIRASEADLVFLSEVVFEPGPRSVNQVVELAERAGFHAWAYGDNYSFGVPWLRVRSGNAILSRLPLRGHRVVQLTGDAPFWKPVNNRRLLLAEIEVDGDWLLCGSVRNDSFDLANNARQARDILAALPDRPVLLAGDFNAQPTDEAMQRFRASGRFLGVFDGAPTFPADRPRRRIDTVLIPTRFARIVSEQVLDVDLSDHEPVMVVVER